MSFLCVCSFINKPPMVIPDGPAVSPSSSMDPTLYSMAPSSSTPAPMFPLVSQGATKRSRKDRTAKYFHFFAVPAAAPLLDSVPFLLSLIYLSLRLFHLLRHTSTGKNTRKLTVESSKPVTL